MIALAAVAGGIALAGVLYESGVRPGWLERFYLEWMISSDALAQRAYNAQVAGKTGEALRMFDAALRRDPASPYRWCDYGEALLAAGQEEKAAKLMRRAVELGPYVGPIRMRAVNFAYRTGNAAWALEQGKRLLAIVDVYDDAVFTAWDRMELGAERVMREGIPDARSAQGYFRRAMGRGEAADARAAWEWMRPRGYVDDRAADEYAGFLVRSREYEAAGRAWAEYAGAREPGYPEKNAVFNGGFERAPAGAVFDWRMDALRGVRAERDGSAAGEGRYSLRLAFDGSENVAFAGVSERARVTAGVYRFEARMRTEGITTDEGIGLRVVDTEAPARVDVRTEPLNGTHDWTPLEAAVRVPAGTELVEVQVVRTPSLKFDSKVSGTVWVDAVGLRRVE